MRGLKISIISLMLVLLMLTSMLVACGGGQETTESPEKESSETTAGGESGESGESAEATAGGDSAEATVGKDSAEDTEKTDGEQTEGNSQENAISSETDETSYAETSDAETSEADTVTESDVISIDSTSAEIGDEETTNATEDTELVGPAFESPYANVIHNAGIKANGVQTYYSPDRSHYTIENQNVTVDYRLTGDSKPMVKALKNSKGQSYLAETMDVYVTNTAGTKYYASGSCEQARVNLYRLGYYYYDVHILEQDFVNSMTVENSVSVPIESFTGYKHVSKPQISNGELTATIVNQEDPQVFAATNSPASDFNYLQFSYKGKSVGAITVYIIAGDKNTHNNAQSFVVEVTSDGSWHTYTVPLNSSTIPGYSGTIKGVRFDFGGAVNTPVAIKDVSYKNIKVDSMPLSLDRVFHTFPDTLHQEIHVVAYKDTNNIAEIGVEYKFPWDSVEKIVAKDASGIVYDLKDVDWDTAEYIAVDVKDVGVIGFILPYDAENYSLTAAKKHGNLLVELVGAPENGTILAPTNSTANDYRMGCRIYTDETHDFAAFIEEAYCERNPLTEKNITIDTEKFVRGAKLKGYDGIRGVYQITLKGAVNFNDPYYKNANLHYNASFSIKGDGHDRSLYMMTFTSSGCLECATILDESTPLRG